MLGVGIQSVGCTGAPQLLGSDPSTLRKLASPLPSDGLASGGSLHTVHQCVVTLNGSQGIPVLSDSERGRVVGRHVRVVLIDKVPTATPDGSYRLRVVSTQHVAMAAWDYREEDWCVMWL